MIAFDLFEDAINNVIFINKIYNNRKIFNFSFAYIIVIKMREFSGAPSVLDILLLSYCYNYYLLDYRSIMVSNKLFIYEAFFLYYHAIPREILRLKRFGV